MKKVFLFALFCGVCALAAAAHVGPAAAYPPANVPGASDPSVTQDNLKTTVCRDESQRGRDPKTGKRLPTYSESVRPPDAFTKKIKQGLMDELHLAGDPNDYELDHLRSIEIGGYPGSPKDMAKTLQALWMQPYAGEYGARVKDQVEDALHRQLCAGKMSLKQVQSCISSDWIACGRKIGRIE
jgi:hypothetical protein